MHNFQKVKGIELHIAEDNSIPNDDDSGYGIIRNGDYKIYIEKECNKIIDLLNNRIIDEKKQINTVDLKRLYTQLLTNMFSKTRPGDNFNITYLNDRVNRAIKDKYNEYNRVYIHQNCIDNADNIIDYYNGTFAGGSRQVDIIDELRPGHYDAIIIAVAHNEFLEMTAKMFRELGKDRHVLYDVKCVLSESEADGRL